MASQMANVNFSRTKQGQEVLRKVTQASKFCIDYPRQANEASPDALSKLSSIHSKQKEDGKKTSENDMMQYTGVSAFSQARSTN